LYAKKRADYSERKANPGAGIRKNRSRHGIRQILIMIPDIIIFFLILRIPVEIPPEYYYNVE
jgi:hypothetical protein